VLTRRGALVGAAMLLLPRTGAIAAGYDRLRAIKLDVTPLRQNGDAISAQVIAETMPPFLQRYFSPYLAPGDRAAPTLVVRVRSMSFGIGGSANSPFGNGAMDSIEGDGVIIGAGGRAVATYPITCSLYTNVDEYDPSGNYWRRRISSLGQAVAQFLPSKMGL
jgi:hypothetical protein